jgi:hypothetical protein
MGEPAPTQHVGAGLTNAVGVVTLAFHQVLKPGKLRTVGVDRNRSKLKARIIPLANNCLKKLQLKLNPKWKNMKIFSTDINL